jgi:GNAT superfamily N-acetyltransferase
MLREFRPSDEDYRSLSEMQRLVYPDYPFSAAEIRHEDESWDRSKYFRWRAILPGIGWAQINHARHAFVPDTYWLDVGVVPDRRRQGRGTAMYRACLEVVRPRGATRIRSGTKESMTDGVAFLAHRGFVETKRDWESRLFLKEFDFGRFGGARERIERAGIRISTLKDEMARDPEAAHKAFELINEVHHDVPSADPPTPLDEPTWRKRSLEGPTALPDAFFVAIDGGGRYLGVSELGRAAEDPTFLWQGLTGTRRDARGKGIAMALKLETVRYAKERGFDHVKTWNDQRNRPMLSINEALGFEKQPAWIQFQKDLEPARPAA